MWRLRHVLVLAAVAGAGVVLSACGGDSSPETPIVVPTESTTAAGLTKADFIAQADSTCAEANAAIQQFADAGQGETEADQIAQLRQGVIDKLNELGPPAEDKTTLDQFITAMQAQVAAGQKIGLAVQRGEDPTQFETELESAKSDASTAASSYGFKDCGSSITSSGTSTSSSSSSSGSSSGGTISPSAPSTSAPSTGGGTSGGSTGGGSTGGGGGSTGGGTGGTGGGSGGIGPG
jgi:hypothetical protein